MNTILVGKGGDGSLSGAREPRSGPEKSGREVRPFVTEGAWVWWSRPLSREAFPGGGNPREEIYDGWGPFGDLSSGRRVCSETLFLPLLLFRLQLKQPVHRVGIPGGTSAPLTPPLQSRLL